MLVSLGGLVLDWLIVTGLHRFPVLGHAEWLIKLAATGLVFFYNFYLKRLVFEGSGRMTEKYGPAAGAGRGGREQGSDGSPVTPTMLERPDTHHLQP